MHCKFRLDWNAYCGDDCPDGQCSFNPKTICVKPESFGGCNGRYKSHFERFCQKTCGFCTDEGSNFTIIWNMISFLFFSVLVIRSSKPFE